MMSRSTLDVLMGRMPLKMASNLCFFQYQFLVNNLVATLMEVLGLDKMEIIRKRSFFLPLHMLLLRKRCLEIQQILTAEIILDLCSQYIPMFNQ